MPGDYLVRHVDMLFRLMALSERETAGQVCVCVCVRVCGVCACVCVSLLRLSEHERPW
jgi:hypothetical protein